MGDLVLIFLLVVSALAIIYIIAYEVPSKLKQVEEKVDKLENRLKEIEYKLVSIENKLDKK